MRPRRDVKDTHAHPAGTTYLGHIGDVNHLLAGRHVAHDADVQRVYDLTLGRHQAVVKLCVFMHIK